MLSGGSAFGLDAASGVQAWLAEQGRGFVVRTARVPIVPAAILFDLLNGGDKSWGRYPPYRELGYDAAAVLPASTSRSAVPAPGLGATTVNLKGGIGSASVERDGMTLGASPLSIRPAAPRSGEGPWFWAAPFERDGEYGGLGFPARFPADALEPITKISPRASTTLAVVATDVQPHQGAGQAAGHHGADRAGPGDPSRAHAARRRRGVRRLDRPPAAGGPVARADRTRVAAANCLARAVARASTPPPRCRSPMRCRHGATASGDR